MGMIAFKAANRDQPEAFNRAVVEFLKTLA